MHISSSSETRRARSAALRPRSHAYTLVVSAMILSMCVSTATGQQVYWTDSGSASIQRADLDGTNIQDLVTGLPRPWEIALDAANGEMYLTDTERKIVARASLDGSNLEQLVSTHPYTPIGIAVDPTDNKVYWSEYISGQSNGCRIRRANSDGTDVEEIVLALSRSGGVAIDVQAGKLYIGERTIWRLLAGLRWICLPEKSIGIRAWRSGAPI